MIDTNVLLRLFRFDDPRHRVIKAALEELNGKGAGLYFSLQNVAEFWNVCTRPAERNGYGLSAAETCKCIEEIERTMTYLPDTEQIYSNWRWLVMANEVRGVQVHDARLAAIMQAYELTHILPLNEVDFLGYANVKAIHPSQIQASSR